jgi:hypothetical protein
MDANRREYTEEANGKEAGRGFNRSKQRKRSSQEAEAEEEREAAVKAEGGTSNIEHRTLNIEH